MDSSFVPKDFEVPATLETDKFRLRMLSMNDVDKDYDAVMTSLDHLKDVFGVGHEWPSQEMTLEEDLVDLEWHQKEFETRSSFTYTVMNLDESHCLGCVYIFPSRQKGYEVDAFLWVRTSEYEKGLDPVLFDVVKTWLKEKWPFERISFPGRD